MGKLIRIATRRSPLALWQAEHVRDRIQALRPDAVVELVAVATQGDRILDVPLAKIGGKGLFIKELEQAMLAGEADLAVHSMKDVPMDLPDGFALAAICEREDPRDALVAGDGVTLQDLPQGARVGTSSLRRAAQLLARRPDLQIGSLRGNLQTRLRKLDEGQFDAIVLAAAGLLRMQMEDRISERLDPDQMLPAVGQGAIGIECRANDVPLLDMLAALHHAETACCVEAERFVNRGLEGGCQVPIAAHARLRDCTMQLDALVASLDGRQVLRASGSCPQQDAPGLAAEIEQSLRDQGAVALLDELASHA